MRPSSTAPDARRGISLVEVLVGIGILVIVFGLLLGMYVSHGRLFARTQASIALQDQMAALMPAIGSLAAVSDGVTASRTINSTAYTSSSTTLILSLPSIDAQAQPIAGSHDYAVFYRDPANAARLLLALAPAAGSVRKATTRQLSDSVKSCFFRYDGAAAVDSASSVSVGITLTQTARNEKITIVSDASYVLGNKVP